mgnify:CR=1
MCINTKTACGVDTKPAKCKCTPVETDLACNHLIMLIKGGLDRLCYDLSLVCETVAKQTADITDLQEACAKPDDQFIDNNKSLNVKVLVKYITRRCKRIGCVVATGKNVVGWSLCNKEDGFDRRIALGMALSRANAKEGPIPYSIQSAVLEMHKRSERYFK